MWVTLGQQGPSIPGCSRVSPNPILAPGDIPVCACGGGGITPGRSIEAVPSHPTPPHPIASGSATP